jgi:hypothetical protein
MSSFLKRLGLVEDDTPAVVPVSVTPVAPQPMVGTGSANDDLIATIVGNIKSKAPENAYFKLRASMDIMMASKLDECSAAKGSSAVLALQSPVITAAVDEAIALVEGERTLFSTTVFKSAIDGAAALDARALDLQAQINSLLEQVKALSEENVNTQAEATKAHSEAEVMAATFDASAAKLNTMLTAEKQKLITYLS